MPPPCWSTARGNSPAFTMNSLPSPCLVCLLLTTGLSRAGSDWSQWRGPNRDGHAPAGAPAPTTLPKDLKPVWKIPVGGGFSAPILAGHKLVYLDENGRREVAHVVDSVSGMEIWQAEYADRFMDEWGAGPRATPMI